MCSFGYRKLRASVFRVVVLSLAVHSASPQARAFFDGVVFAAGTAGDALVERSA